MSAENPNAGYQVLARKWRPQKFGDVVGQEAVVRTLKRALETERVAHAFLFTGSRGIGKTTLARLMAKSLCCATGITPDPCGECTQCREIAAGSAIDVVEIDGASHTGVDDVRELREATRFQPQSCRFKVFIIDEVHMLSTSAFNALLKTLEEPPPHVKFIFATTEPHKIPVTILSRCQRYDFKRIPQSVIVGRLQHILVAESLHISDAGLHIIARAAEGGMRDALSLTDQVLSFAGDGADEAAVVEALGLIDRRAIVALTDAIVDRDARAALTEVERAFTQGHDLRQLMESVTAEVRHLNVAAATGSVDGFADIAPEEVAAIDAKARTKDPRDLQRLFQASLDAVDLIAKAENTRLAMELAVLKLCQRPPVADAMAVSEALVRLDALVRGKPVPPLSAGSASGPAERVVRETLSARKPSSPSAEPASASSSPSPSSSPSSPPSSAAPPASPSSPPSAPPAPSTPSSSVPSSTAVSGAPVSSAPSSSAPPLAVASPSPPPSKPPPSATVPPPSSRSTSTSTSAGNGNGKAAPATASGEGEATEADDDAELLDPSLGLELEDVDPTWVAFVDEVARSAQRLGGHLAHGYYLGSEGGRARVCFENELHASSVADAATSPPVKAALSLLGEVSALEVVARPDGRLSASVAEARHTAMERAREALEAHARSHPVVRRAIELFGGEVRSVRP